MGWYKLWFSIDAETKYAAIIWDIDSAVGCWSSATTHQNHAQQFVALLKSQRRESEQQMLPKHADWAKKNI